jgi:hypothetical protein
MRNIDRALNAAMLESTLNNVMAAVDCVERVADLPSGFPVLRPHWRARPVIIRPYRAGGTQRQCG